MLDDKFWAKVNIADNFEECWEWQGHRDYDGYGKFAITSGVSRSQAAETGEPRIISFLAHRLAFFLVQGWWPDTARHQCNNPPCCNPAHILDGTPGDNNRDTYKFNRRNDKRSANGRFEAHCGDWND